MESVYKRRLICEDSLEGIFSGVYYIYEKKYDKSCIELKIEGNNENYELFTIDEFVQTNMEKAVKVARTVKRKFGIEVYEDLVGAALAESEGKAQAIFRTIQYGLSNHMETELLNNLKNEDVFRVFELKRKVYSEAHRYLEFVRFSELQNGVLYSKISPENNILPLIAEHFSDRLKNENFVIHDIKRKSSLVYHCGYPWEIYKNIEVMDKKLEFAECEESVKKLWKAFCRSVSIDERCNLELQKQLLPLKFRKFMTEFV